MNKTDMELQAIKDKLLSLQAEPAAAEGLSAPWPGPQQASYPVYMGESTYRQQLTAQSKAAEEAEESRQAMAIKALRKRSGNPQADNMVAQEINRLEVLANNINERSQQQATEIVAMKRSAQQAAVALRRQGVHDHPKLQVIEQFLSAYPSTSVPLLERDNQGQFRLNHTVVDLHHAEQEASNIANALRRRQSVGNSVERERLPYNSDLFREPISPEVAGNRQAKSSGQRGSASSQKGSTLGLKKLLASLSKIGQRQRTKAPDLDNLPQQSERVSGNSAFSWTDAAIWFSGAAIARIILEAIVVSVPLLRMPILLLLFSVISFSIYRVVVAKSIEMPAVYRLAITLIGLIVGGSL